MSTVPAAQPALPRSKPRKEPPVNLLAGAIALIAILFFSPILANNFILVDDPLTVQNNPDFNPPAADTGISRELVASGGNRAAGFAHYWTAPTGERYVPLTYTLWGVVSSIAKTTDQNGASAGLSPAVYHAVSLLLHALNAVLVLLILRKLVAGAWPAFFGAALFAVHPLQTEAVAWISQMSILLGSFFSLWAILEFLRFTDTRLGPGEQFAPGKPDDPTPIASHGGGWFHYSLATLALALALLSHPMAVITPVLVLIIERLRRRNWNVLAAPLAIWVFMCVPIAVMTQLWRTAGASIPLQDRPIIAADALAFYLYKLFLPIGLLPNYGRTPAWLFAQHSLVIWTWAVPAALAVVSILLWRKARWLMASSLLFAIALLPGLGLNFLGSNRFSTTADRYAYLAMLGAALALACLLARQARAMTFMAACVLLLFMAGLTIRQAMFWSDTVHLYSRATDAEPDNRDAQEMLATAYDARSKEDLKNGNKRGARDDMTAARDHFLVAAGLPHDDGISHYNAAWCELHLGHFEAALKEADAALSDPGFPLRPEAYLMKGAIYEKNLGNLDAASKSYEQAVAASDASRRINERKAALEALNGLEMRRSVGAKATTRASGKTDQSGKRQAPRSIRHNQNKYIIATDGHR